MQRDLVNVMLNPARQEHQFECCWNCWVCFRNCC